MEGQSNNKDVGTVLLMLDNKCLPPCYCFEADGHEVRSISPEILDEVLEWASRFKPSPPSMMYMVGAPQELDEEVQSVLEDVAGSVICAPMQKTEQEKAGLPFSRTQMVVFPSLVDFEKDKEIIRGRSCIVHIGCGEISRWSSVIKALPQDIPISKIRFRPRNLHLWDRSQLKAYKNQFVELEAFKYHLNAAGVTVEWELSYMDRCPALRNLVTIGPDGLCYPCPTFYYAGQTNGLGAFKTLDSDRVFSQSPEQTCRLCQSEHCEACLFLESGHAAGEVKVCELPTGMDGDTSWEEIIWRKDRSGYMFESFKSTSISEVTGEANKSLWASEQVDDISLEDFISALKSINQTAHAVMNGATEVSENIISQYEKLVESGPKTQKALFSYEHFTKSLENIHRQTGTVTEESAEDYSSVLSQYRQSVKTDQISRKGYFFEKVKEILSGLVELNFEAVNKHTLRSRLASPIRDSISDTEEEDETGKLSLSEHEVTSIRQLYEIFLGWSFLYSSLTDELKYDFCVNREMIEVTQKKMIEARIQMKHWFHQTGPQHGWENREGYNYFIDFESNLNVSRVRYKKILHRSPGLKNKKWTQVLELDGIEKEVIERLSMILQTTLTEVKQCLSQHLAGLDVERDLEVAIKKLGHGFLDSSRWYHGMVREYNWPQYSDWRVTNEWIVEGK
jgi:hypothetical protein